MTSEGGSIGYYSGNLSRLADDITELKPTVMIGVPRVFTRLYDRIMNTVKNKGKIERLIFDKGFSAKTKNISKDKNSVFWDLLVFKKIKKRLGGRVNLIISGSAPLSEEHHNFLRVCFTKNVSQGYGLTETTAAGALGILGGLSLGNCGPPKPCCEIKLVDVPEMNYKSKNNVGEIWIRGPSVFQGYFKDEKKTLQVLTEDGWFKTGDIGRFNENGTLSIIDRKKNIIKLSNGEYIALEQLESIFVQSRIITQIWVYANSFEDFPVAIIVPDLNALKIKKENLEEEIKKPQFIKRLKMEIFKLAKQFQLTPFSIPRNFYIESNLFTIEDDLITDTMKYKRINLLNKYQETINNLYKEIHEEEEKKNKSQLKEKK
ncbi:long-chain-fatty-acid--coa ligase [Anaeramoeba flamelloides]|uniref:Long-chain-fatty-acid--coa ligase n=1 Tax=Anaeramoeba flamelloides TaxID=1746091 RepID=A0AAV8A7W2_9EUKA|nr:long-chain-fatty-acid--coa ligase [Anaeramoeba flamelloides]